MRAPGASLRAAGCTPGLSATAGSQASTSSMRSAATPARGSMMEIMPIIKKLITTSMLYVMNAMRSPVWMVPAST